MATVSKDRSSTTKANKERYKAKVETRLAKRKLWRLAKFETTPLTDLSRTTLELFCRWGHRKDECTRVLKQKKYTRQIKKGTK